MTGEYDRPMDAHGPGPERERLNTVAMRDLGDGVTEFVFDRHTRVWPDGRMTAVTGRVVRGDGGELDLGVIRDSYPGDAGFTVTP